MEHVNPVRVVVVVALAAALLGALVLAAQPAGAATYPSSQPGGYKLIGTNSRVDGNITTTAGFQVSPGGRYRSWLRAVDAKRRSLVLHVDHLRVREVGIATYGACDSGCAYYGNGVVYRVGSWRYLDSPSTLYQTWAYTWVHVSGPGGGSSTPRRCLSSRLVTGSGGYDGGPRC